jgi:hypothetical protein
MPDPGRGGIASALVIDDRVFLYPWGVRSGADGHPRPPFVVYGPASPAMDPSVTAPRADP